MARPSRIKPWRVRFGCVCVCFPGFLGQLDGLVEVIESVPTGLALAGDARFIVNGRPAAVFFNEVSIWEIMISEITISISAVEYDRPDDEDDMGLVVQYALDQSSCREFRQRSLSRHVSHCGVRGVQTSAAKSSMACWNSLPR